MRVWNVGGRFVQIYVRRSFLSRRVILCAVRQPMRKDTGRLGFLSQPTDQPYVRARRVLHHCCGCGSNNKNNQKYVHRSIVQQQQRRPADCFTRWFIRNRVFLDTLEPYVLVGKLKKLSPEVLSAFVERCSQVGAKKTKVILEYRALH